eukprot:TRINITY_DN1003_c0_g1_i1.p1 TRINITY_DN1003_c0_g1~~TRINITY_DN1003_c0_g1_i1.p1  ORF type:complete len:816 (-),score=188.08 TRINITY_DN1003_c0_g1_i1:154-2601(-)
MDLLDAMLKHNIRLMDYERITDEKNRRLVKFGKFAGLAGMIDCCRTIGDRLLSLGFSTPFLHAGWAHMYPSLDAAKQALTSVGATIRKIGLPPRFAPLVFVFTGAYGNVGQGARDVFETLPFKKVTVADLPELCRHAQPNPISDKSAIDREYAEEHRHQVYGVYLTSADVVEHKEGKPFDRDEYHTHPENYRGVFMEKIAPYVSILVNCTYWDERFPRFMTCHDIKDLRARHKSRLLAVADISCDIQGSLEFMRKASTIDKPTYVYDPDTGHVHDGIEGRGIPFMGVDNLPCELPHDATEYFGDSLSPFLEAIAHSDITVPYEEMKKDLPPAMFRAIVTCHGELTPSHRYIEDMRREHEKHFRRILLLGSGRMTPPVLDYVLSSPDYFVTIASTHVEDAVSIARSVDTPFRASIKVEELNVVTDEAKLDALVKSADVVIVMIPAELHTIVAKACIKHKKGMVTACYERPDLKAMHEEAQAAGVTILTEMGLDPGIDHVTAMEMFENVKEKGGKILSFRSMSGGVPAPEATDNPFFYKFSWAPRDMLCSSLMPAKYKKDGVVIECSNVFDEEYVEILNIPPCFCLECIPNRDSTVYIDLYGIEDTPTIFRGTFRYKGFSRLMRCLGRLGLFDTTPQPFLAPTAPNVTWEQIMQHCLGCQDVRAAVVEKLNLKNDEKKVVLDSLEWLGLFNNTDSVDKRGSYLDTLCHTMQDMLYYGEEQRDMVILHHIAEIAWPDGRKEDRTSTLIVYGDSSHTAMAKTVALPTACAACRILDGTIKATGVLMPLHKDIYGPILKDLKECGVTTTVSSRVFPAGTY